MQTLKKVVSVLVALSPFLNNYMVPGIGVNAGLCVILLFLVFSYMYHPRIVGMFSTMGRQWRGLRKITIVLLVYFLLSSIMAYFRSDCTASVFADVAITYLVLYPAIKRLEFRVLDNKLVIKVIEIVAVLTGIIICIQYLLYYGVGISDRWVWVPLKKWTYAYEANYMKTSVFSGMLRPSGIFTEPSHYSIYCCIALANKLIGQKRPNYAMSGFLTIACILSTSGMGIAIMAFVWLYHLLTCNVTVKRKVSLIITASIVGGLAFVLFYQFIFFRLSLERILSTSGSMENAYTGRTYTSYFLDNLTLMQRVFGMGYRNVPTQLNSFGADTSIFMVSIVEIQYCLGFVGTALFLWICLLLILRTRGVARLIVVMYVIRFFISAVTNLPSLFFYTAMIFLYRENTTEKKAESSAVSRKVMYKARFNW